MHKHFPGFYTSCLLFLFLFSCKKEEKIQPPVLLEDQYKNIRVSSRIEDQIPIQSKEWRLEYVKDLNTGAFLLDEKGQRLSLEGFGSVNAANEWLKLERTEKEKGLFITLKENLSETPRQLSFGLIEKNGNKEVIHITQQRASSYKIISEKIKEIEESVKVYESAEECNPLRLNNNSKQERWMSTTAVFNNVGIYSEFISDDYGAFDWIKQNDNVLLRSEIILNGETRWAQPVVYKKGQTIEPYIRGNKVSESLLMKPYTSAHLSGEITYYERTSEYTLTIRNEDSGKSFEVSGLWKQRIPIAHHTIIND